MTTKKQKTITGEISQVKYRNASGWCVFKLAGKPLSLTGTLPEIVDVGSDVTCTGTIEVNNFGQQMKCTKIIPAAPDVSTESGVIKLLQRLPGIGPKRAMAAVQEHGHKEAWSLALTDPVQIGVPPAQTEGAIETAHGLLENYENIVYLLGIGLTNYQVALIQEAYGKYSKSIVSRDPYQLINIDGFGFLTVDKIALKAGVTVGNASRIAACIMYVLNDSTTNGGHVWHNGWNLIETVLEMLTASAMKAEVSLSGMPDKEQVRERVHFLKSEGRLYIEKGKVFCRELLVAERSILAFIGGPLHA